MRKTSKTLSYLVKFLLYKDISDIEYFDFSAPTVTISPSTFRTTGKLTIVSNVLLSY